MREWCSHISIFFPPFFILSGFGAPTYICQHVFQASRAGIPAALIQVGFLTTEPQGKPSHTIFLFFFHFFLFILFFLPYYRVSLFCPGQSWVHDPLASATPSHWDYKWPPLSLALFPFFNHMTKIFAQRPKSKSGTVLEL